MTTALTASQARAKLYRIMDETAKTHKPILITGKRTNSILISEDDWAAIQETLYLSSIPDMVKSIKEGGKIPLDECIDEEDIDWETGK